MRPTHTVDVALLLSIEQAKLTMESEEREDVIPWTLAHFYSVLTQNTQNSGSGKNIENSTQVENLHKFSKYSL